MQSPPFPLFYCCIFPRNSSESWSVSEQAASRFSFKGVIVSHKQRLIGANGTILLFLIAPAWGQTLYNNGGLSTGATLLNGTAAPAGYTWSELQRDPANITFLNNTLGFGANGSGQR